MELNPNHKVTAGLRDEWHKIVAIALHKQGIKELVITWDDILAFSGNTKHNTIVAQEKADGLHIYLTGEAEALELIAKAGGRG